MTEPVAVTGLELFAGLIGYAVTVVIELRARFDEEANIQLATRLQEAGAHVVGTDSVYGPSRVVVEKYFSRFGVESSFVDTSDAANIEAAIRPETTMLYIETPENPTIRLTDIAACATIAGDHELLLVVDNTFATPLLQNPLDLGADIVVHSMTKFLNGHADVVAGIIVTSTEEQWSRLRTTLPGGYG